ncbi:hypothetical protein KCTCHS21_20090 [Cohnella abietis]|uniref:Uncharacterized protein n=1 Tax=Cohnella abietis TaxID=2507935 RepID=A0A3T1D3C0_9BACL|nr:hypothetical protein KCTCHS21_20090 [Cohnella abietis]
MKYTATIKRTFKTMVILLIRSFKKNLPPYVNDSNYKINYNLSYGFYVVFYLNDDLCEKSYEKSCHLRTNKNPFLGLCT